MSQAIATNPFQDEPTGDACDSELVHLACAGDRDALEQLVRQHQPWVYNVALRMVWEPADAEDVTQEVLVKVISRLSTFQGRSGFRTWLYRIAFNHVMTMKRRSIESADMSFGSFKRGLAEILDDELPDRSSVSVDLPVLVEEAKTGCTMAMLLCLDRRQRLAYVLGEVFGSSTRTGSELMDTSPANFRQLLSRARRDLHAFMNEQCGLVNPENPCRCPKKTRGFIQKGYVDPNHLRFDPRHVQTIRQTVGLRGEAIDAAAESHQVRLYRDHPFCEPPNVVTMLRHILDREDVRSALNLDERG